MVQNQILVHVWDDPSTVLGCGGSFVLNGPLGPDKAPWSFTPFNNPSETYIQRDGNVLLACEAVSRLLYPSLVLEAEDKTDASSPVSTESNNTGPPDDDFNGGVSVVDISANDWLSYDFQPPARDSSDYDYNFLLRVANDGVSQS